jgi:hypothetical protein
MQADKPKTFQIDPTVLRSLLGCLESTGRPDQFYTPCKTAQALRPGPRLKPHL